MNFNWGANKQRISAKGHGDVVSNLRERKEGWKYAAVVLGVVSAILAFTLAESSGRVQTILLPYHISAAGSGMPYNVNNLSESQRYLGVLARSDIAMLTIWDPDTIRSQFNHFLRRCTPQAYQHWEFKLPKYAKQMRNDNITEMFFFQGEKFVPPYSVDVEGLLVRTMGHHVLFRRPVQYIVSYAPNNGIFSIANVQAQVKGSKIPRSVLHVQ
ncbi:TraE/TraK family type IV conjugative transfer system protein [Acidithiobacillus sp. M4-SHS-6]|uniref:TraE/TraK family type IV conjugative transfer system protein n=1 Tax=Acidithiobacillus sp. M4-SHS-6 TaxID=3383024 RepID=UPI0039BDFD97